MNKIDKNILNSFGHYWDEDSEDFPMGNSDNSDQSVMINSEYPDKIWLVEEIKKIETLSNETDKVKNFEDLSINERVQLVFNAAPHLVKPVDSIIFLKTTPLEFTEKATNDIESVSGKALLWNAIANALGDYSEYEIASERFGHAINQADKLPEGQLKNYVNTQITLCLIEHGYLDQANVMSDKFIEEEKQLNVKNKIIDRFLSIGHVDKAIEVADTVSEGYSKQVLYAELAKMLTNHNYLDEAVNIIDKINYPSIQHQLYQSIYIKDQYTLRFYTNSHVIIRMQAVGEKMYRIQRAIRAQ